MTTIEVVSAYPLNQEFNKKSVIGETKFDWAMALLSIWFVGGIFLDGWAHENGKVDSTFFTPWHAVLYSGFGVVAAFIGWVLWRNLSRGLTWQEALPAGYHLSAWGVVIFGFGGMGDLIWHTLFGIEADLAALLSPTHLVLAIGAALVAIGPLNAAWKRTESSSTWSGWLPALLSLTFFLSVLGFFTQYAHPTVVPAGISFTHGTAETPSGEAASAATTAEAENNLKEMEIVIQVWGLISIFLQTGILMAFLLLVVRRWQLPFGSLTWVFTLHTLLMLTQPDHEVFWPVAFVAVLAGLICDVLLRVLRPTTRPQNFRWFAFAVPVVYYSLYFLCIQLVIGIHWVVHLWTGAIVMAGIIGLLVSYLVLPPEMPKAAVAL